MKVGKGTCKQGSPCCLCDKMIKKKIERSWGMATLISIYSTLACHCPMQICGSQVGCSVFELLYLFPLLQILGYVNDSMWRCLTFVCINGHKHQYTLALSSFITITQYKIKQAQCNPIPIEKQIVIVCAIVEGYLNEIHTMI